MKKSVMIWALLLGVVTAASAQNEWTGTSVPTTTVTGNVGIGLSSPVPRLDIRSVTGFGSSDVSGLRITNVNGGAGANIAEILNGPQTNPPTDPTALFWVRGDGKVGIYNSLRIGATEATGSYAGYKLSVDGDMVAKRCVIQVDSWADYVFAKNYKLPSLAEVANYIEANSHLPGIPSEQEVKNNGVDIGAMNKALLAKVEELTLYLIELKKENEKIKLLMEKNGIQ